MGRCEAEIQLKGSFCKWFLFSVFWVSGCWDGKALQVPDIPGARVTYNLVPSVPSTSPFGPIQISPAVVHHRPSTSESMAPMYPSFPSTYNPVLTGKCLVNFSTISDILDRTASDCSAPLAALVGNVICCPQVRSLLHIFQGNYSTGASLLVLEDSAANDCFSDIMSILSGRGANSTIPAICSVKPSNLTGGSCPVKDVATFEKLVNTSKLLDACSMVDPLKECCRPACQPAIIDAAVHLSSGGSSSLENANVSGGLSQIDILNDCKGVVYAWLSRNLLADAANTAFRNLYGCKVNKVCPLEFKEPALVVKSCSNRASPNPSCCSSLNTYVASLQKQMLITNRQALNCATYFGSQLQKAGVMTNVYELCDIDLKDFSLQAFGQQGCLLRSLPTDVIFDNSSGFSFICDLNDNIAAPWPSSSSLSTLSLCAPEMSLPALPTTETSGSLGWDGIGSGFGLPILLLVIRLLIWGGY
ncbi:unnamed protein product [Victoria cruziana]